MKFFKNTDTWRRTELIAFDEQANNGPFNAVCVIFDNGSLIVSRTTYFERSTSVEISQDEFLRGYAGAQASIVDCLKSIPVMNALSKIGAAVHQELLRSLFEAAGGEIANQSGAAP